MEEEPPPRLVGQQAPLGGKQGSAVSERKKKEEESKEGVPLTKRMVLSALSGSGFLSYSRLKNPEEFCGTLGSSVVTH